MAQPATAQPAQPAGPPFYRPEPVAAEVVQLAASAASRDVDAAMTGDHDGTRLAVSRPGGLAGVLPPTGGAGILLIEDEPSAARLLRTYLESAGYKVRLASTGEEGLRMARQRIPDAVVLDVLLPGIDGWEVLRLFKQDPTLCEVPVFVASVVDERDVGMSLGATDFFVKPIDRQRLLARVAEYLLKPAEGPDRMHVLAVDDDPATLAAIANTLRRQHVDVVTTTSGTEAVRLARSRTFDLIISDLLMPDIDGISLMSALDHDPTTSQIPVLMVTGADLSDADRTRVGAKALGILPKGDAVHDALHHWMSQLPRPGTEAAGSQRGTQTPGPQTAPLNGPEAAP
jgi:DNA-binding response OmpR family regulator